MQDQEGKLADFISHYPDSNFIRSLILRLRYFLPGENPHVCCRERPASKWATTMTRPSTGSTEETLASLSPAFLL